MPSLPIESASDIDAGQLQLGVDVSMRLQGATITFDHADLSLQVEPLLTFESVSPDRFWTLFSPEPAKLQRLSRAWTQPLGLVAEYNAGYPSALEARLLDGGNTINVAAASQLRRPIYSHLNSYAAFYVFGMGQALVAFSPCPSPIEILPSDYPTGRPARFATLKENGRFEVLEATDGEKGPFDLLGHGSLVRGDSLVMTLHNNRRPAFRITLRDWSDQASTQISPTAGWGAPENAIEFSRNDSGSLVVIHVTLAGTSVGRGWDSVGHAAGTYRNRMTIERL